MKSKILILILCVFVISNAIPCHASIEPVNKGSSARRGLNLNTKSSKPTKPAYTIDKQGRKRCDPFIFRHSCNRDMRGVGAACDGKFAECECVYKNQEVLCTKYQTCTKTVCGNVCLKCDGEADPTINNCPDGYSKDITSCKWPLTLLSSNGCGKCDPNCADGTSTAIKYCDRGYKIKMSASGCGECVKE